MMDFGYSGQEVNPGPDFIVAETFDHCFHKGGAVAHHAFDKLNAAGRQHDKLLASVFGVFDHCDQVEGRLGQRTEGFRDRRTRYFVPRRQRMRDVLATHLLPISAARMDGPEETGLLACQHAAFEGVLNLHSHQIVDREKQVEEILARLFALRKVHPVSGSLLRPRR